MKKTIPKNKAKNGIKKNTIKAIIWDNVGVLWNTKSKFPWVDLLGVPLEALIQVITGSEHDMWNMDEISTDEFYDFLIRELGLPSEEKALLSHKSATQVVIDNELLIYINSLKNRFTLAMLTNFPREWFENRCKQWPELIEPFDHIISSFEEKLLNLIQRSINLRLTGSVVKRKRRFSSMTLRKM